jgi:hypothetical protein
MEVIIERPGAVDVHKKTIVVCVRVPDASRCRVSLPRRWCAACHDGRGERVRWRGIVTSFSARYWDIDARGDGLAARIGALARLEADVVPLHAAPRRAVVSLKRATGFAWSESAVMHSGPAGGPSGRLGTAMLGSERAPARRRTDPSGAVHRSRRTGKAPPKPRYAAAPDGSSATSTRTSRWTG